MLKREPAKFRVLVRTEQLNDTNLHETNREGNDMTFDFHGVDAQDDDHYEVFSHHSNTSRRYSSPTSSTVGLSVYQKQVMLKLDNDVDGCRSVMNHPARCYPDSFVGHPYHPCRKVARDRWRSACSHALYVRVMFHAM
ncbi:hypothetical protein V1477_003781 [Vespula maculifrons]|uniref:Uncharacterized protein n=1 Tax=Vespula maculifrons TaxID=7453 RepID=A0ABD2CSB5_VESMC